MRRTPIFGWQAVVSSVLVLMLAGCGTPTVRTEQTGPLAWPTESPVLPEADNRYAMEDTVPAGSAVTLSAPRKQLSIEGGGDDRRIEQRRLYTDSNGLPLIELPGSPDDAMARVQDALAALGWEVERVRRNESRIEIDGSQWLDRRTDQLFPSRPLIHIYFYPLGNGTQIHLERDDPELAFPVTEQRDILQRLYSELE